MSTIKVLNYALVVFRFKLFESYEISKILGYAQHGSLRKQTLSSWTEVLDAEKDYWMIYEESQLRRYEHAYKEAGNGTLKPVSSKRGRLFFTPSGLRKVFDRTSKPTEELRAALTLAGYGGLDVKEFVSGQPCRRCKRPLDRSQDCPCTPAPKVVAKPKQRIPANTVPVAITPLSREDRMFEYEIMQKLLGQLQTLTAPTLRGLAITAAETALGRELSDLRLGEAVQTILKPVAAPVAAPAVNTGPVTVQGPLFVGDDYFSMTRIGEKAGGYSARQAGKAADIVASSHGWTHDQIRTVPLPINQVSMRPDSTSGKERQMVRFHTDFANKVVVELRENPKFSPSLVRGVPTFSLAGAMPLLSRGPFE